MSSNPFEKMNSALDRFQEAHFWIHMMERFYHDADPFKWHLNVFLKALKEVPQIVQMELQHESGFPEWFKNKRTVLHNDPLLNALGKHRDLVVHQKMLIPNSRGTLGITEGRGMKLGLSFPIHPLEDSESAMERYLHYLANNNIDFLGVLANDEDSLPCVHRQWHLEGLMKKL